MLRNHAEICSSKDEKPLHSATLCPALAAAAGRLAAMEGVHMECVHICTPQLRHMPFGSVTDLSILGHACPAITAAAAILAAQCKASAGQNCF
eukprot:scaffold1626_cov19-Tisochrysis_lutea.AAC.2